MDPTTRQKPVTAYQSYLQINKPTIPVFLLPSTCHQPNAHGELIHQDFVSCFMVGAKPQTKREEQGTEKNCSKQSLIGIFVI